MDAAKSFLKNQGIVPKISFKDGRSHTVELGKAKEVTFTDKDGTEKAGVEFLVKEEGEGRTFLTTSIKLIQELANYEAGDTVVIQMKSFKDGGEFKSTYEVNPVKGDKVVTANEDNPDDIDVDDIPF